LANCKHLGKTFFCDGCSVLQTNIVDNCHWRQSILAQSGLYY
jgi:hypothetical protein